MFEEDTKTQILNTPLCNSFNLFQIQIFLKIWVAKLEVWLIFKCPLDAGVYGSFLRPL